MLNIFISYAHEDRDFAQEMIEELQKKEFTLWIDSENLRAGRDWRLGIDEGIRNSFVVVVIMTPDAKLSEYVTYEWAFALGIEVPVIPLLLKPTQLHPRLEVLQYLDFTKRRFWERLANQLTEYQRESALKRKLRVSLVRDSNENEEYIIDTHNKARKLPDYNTTSFLKNVLGWLGNVPEVSAEEIIKMRGEPIVPVDKWDRVRPKTIEEEIRYKANAELQGDANFYEDSGVQRITFLIRNVGEQVITIKLAKFSNINNSFAAGDISSTHLRKDGYIILTQHQIVVDPKDSCEVHMFLNRVLSANEITRITNKIGFLILDVLYENYETDVICAL